jgi:hypothetical protein
VGLEEVLDQINSSDLEWHLIFFDAISKIGADFDVRELAKGALATPVGLIFSDEGLRVLARQLFQVIECEILGFPKSQPVSSRESLTMKIDAFDSTEWTVQVGAGERHRVKRGSILSEV